MNSTSLKCCVVGDGCVGKTCLLIRFAKNEFCQDYVPTVFDNHATDLVCDGKVINLQLWDTAGQEAYDRLRPISYANTDIFLVCYSIDSQSSYNNVKQLWVPEIQHYCKDVPFILVANKMDTRKNNDDLKRPLITTQSGLKLAKEINATEFVECSALTMENVNTVFDKAVRAVINPKKKEKKIISCLIL